MTYSKCLLFCTGIWWEQTEFIVSRTGSRAHCSANDRRRNEKWHLGCSPELPLGQELDAYSGEGIACDTKFTFRIT